MGGKTVMTSVKFIAASMGVGLLVSLGGCAVSEQEAGNTSPAAAASVPTFAYDKTFPKPLPNSWKLGTVIGVSVDSRDHIWIIQRPSTLKNSEMEATNMSVYGGFRGPVAGCCRPAPPVIEFDQDGNMVQAWGGPAEDYEWPTPGPHGPDPALGGSPFGERGVYVDHNDNVWIGADGPGDGQMLKFSRFGKLHLQVGRHGQSNGSSDTENLNGASGFAVDAETNEVFVADGLGNRRVIVFDAYTGAYKRHWGAYGNAPDDSVPFSYDPQVRNQQFEDVHGIALSRDGLVYVCDRSNNRVQVFQRDGTFVKEGLISPETLKGTAYDIAFSADPEQRFAYVVDGQNEKVWIILRDSMEVVGSFGAGGHWGGAFTTAHSIATDSRGNIYVGETWEGKRVQRFLYMGQTP